MEPGLLTSPEVSRLLGVSTRTVHRLVVDGRLEAAQKLPGPNGAFLFARSAVDAYAAAKAAEAQPDGAATPSAPQPQPVRVAGPATCSAD